MASRMTHVDTVFSFGRSRTGGLGAGGPPFPSLCFAPPPAADEDEAPGFGLPVLDAVLLLLPSPLLDCFPLPSSLLAVLPLDAVLPPAVPFLGDPAGVISTSPCSSLPGLRSTPFFRPEASSMAFGISP